jgi:hypothetical protein
MALPELNKMPQMQNTAKARVLLIMAYISAQTQQIQTMPFEEKRPRCNATSLTILPPSNYPGRMVAYPSVTAQ